MFPLAPPPPPPMFQPLPPPLPYHATPYFAQPSPLPLPHATFPYPYYSNNGGLVAHHAMAAPPVLGLHIIPVTAANYEAELDTIGSLLTSYPFVTIDTEYPGTIHRPATHRESYNKLTPPERYKLVKANVDDLPIVQLGITLCDEYGNLPTVVGIDGRPSELVWEVTFSDFDPSRDRHAPESVAFLRSRGVDFDRSRTHGVSSSAFAAKLAAVLLSATTTLTWSAFGGAYDFGYVVKMLAGGRPMPETWHEFVAEARELLGGRLFDAKYIAEHCEREDLCGGGSGLRRVAERLFVHRPPDFEEHPAACLAGRKSHSACRVYTAMRRRVLYRDGGASLEGLIDGFHH